MAATFGSKAIGVASPANSKQIEDRARARQSPALRRRRRPHQRRHHHHPAASTARATEVKGFSAHDGSASPRPPRRPAIGFITKRNSPPSPSAPATSRSNSSTRASPQDRRRHQIIADEAELHAGRNRLRRRRHHRPPRHALRPRHRHRQRPPQVQIRWPTGSRPNPGGHGAGRDAIDFILAARGSRLGSPHRAGVVPHQVRLAHRTPNRRLAQHPRGDPTLISAPTGSGKTLAAFLVCIDKLLRAKPSKAAFPRTPHVVYISPLKALSNDVQKNLDARSPRSSN
jgi:hypothetical protein